MATSVAGLVTVTAAMGPVEGTLMPALPLGRGFMTVALFLLVCTGLVRLAVLVVRRTRRHRLARHRRPLLPAHAWHPR
ncbi:hypothetical protein [Streptomyces sp. NPDC056632]|uniref:hypothetical protein n=1 Tax=Streptomyces sp. NPDC056632 TaxID=3345884 RepID=UPI00368700A7